MARTVKEIMNTELLLLRPDDDVEGALAKLTAFSVSGAAVVDSEGVALGVVSWKDLVGRSGSIGDAMSTPPESVSPDSTIEQVASLLAEKGHHRLVVIDREKVPVGMLSVLDVLRGMLGRPTQHPPAFPHYDRSTRLAWSDDFVLTKEQIQGTPQVGGLVVLLHVVANERDRILWAEATDKIQFFLESILEEPKRRLGGQARWLADGSIQARYACVPELEKRQSALSQVLLAERDRRRTEH